MKTEKLLFNFKKIKKHYLTSSSLSFDDIHGIVVRVLQNDGTRDVVLAQTTISLSETVTLDVASVSSYETRLSTASADVGSSTRIPVLGYYEIDSVQNDVLVMECNNDDFDDDYRFGFNGQEKVNEIAGIGNHNTALFWEYDTRLGRRWNLDPVDQVSISNYAAFENNPIYKNDVLGNTPDPSTEVKENNNGTYTVTGGQADGDRNIYVVGNDGKRTGKVIGKSLTEYSFLSDEGNPVKGAIINPSDNSGINFLNNEIIGGDLGLLDYMPNATGGEIYDFKTRGIGKIAPQNRDKYKYRGMPFEGVAHFGNQDGSTTTFGSARDFGNVAAGFVAGSNGLSWGEARLGFDGLQKYQQGRFGATEGNPTQLAERKGYDAGIKLHTNKNVERILKEATSPVGPKW